jgi:D-sedoheptulose 7-phosphate isomerase
MDRDRTLSGIENFMDSYLLDLRNALNEFDVNDLKEITEILLRANAQGKTVFFCGQGGSAATASHMSNDLSKISGCPGLKRFKSISLTDNVSQLTAWINDIGYEQCFVEALKCLLQDGDVLIALSGSGNSMSVVNAVDYVNEHRGVTIGMTGLPGGKLAEIAQKTVRVKTENMQRIEDSHLAFAHILFSYIRHLYSPGEGSQP